MAASPNPTGALLGRGLLRPMRRDQKADFAAGEGVELVVANVGQILMTRATTPASPGELPWRPEFGSRLHQFRHMLRVEGGAQLALVMVREALRRWEPRARVTKVGVVPGGSDRELRLRVLFDVVDRLGRPISSGQSAEVSFPQQEA